MGHCLQMLHLLWCLALSDAEIRWSTGSQTSDCGSIFTQSMKWLDWISAWPPACEKQPNNILFIIATNFQTFPTLYGWKKYTISNIDFTGFSTHVTFRRVRGNLRKFDISHDVTGRTEVTEHSRHIKWIVCSTDTFVGGSYFTPASFRDRQEGGQIPW